MDYHATAQNFRQSQSLTADAFRPFGNVTDTRDGPDLFINGGRCARHDDRARLDFGDGGAGISLFDSDIVTMPYPVATMERHPLGSQAFLPVGAARSLVVVAEDEGGKPTRIRAFISAPGQGFNILRNVWHSVLAPLDEGRFFVIDRIGDSPNLETHDFGIPIIVVVSEKGAS